MPRTRNPIIRACTQIELKQQIENKSNLKQKWEKYKTLNPNPSVAVRYTNRD